MRRGSVVLVAAAALAWPAVGAQSVRADDLARTAVSFRALERYFYDSGAADYRDALGDKPGSHAWPLSQALAAHIAVAALPQVAAHASVRARLALLERRFRNGTTYTAWPGGAVYFDDNEWLAQDLLRWSRISGDRSALRRAAAIFGALTSGWDRSPNHPCAGGVFWTSAHGNRDRNTVSTANAAVVAMRLFAATHAHSYLAWSRRLLGWLDRCLLAPNGLYWDHIDLDGSVDRTQWSYNQGSVIAANVLLYDTTRDRSALAAAEQIADAALDQFDDEHEPPEFAVVLFRSVLALADVDGRQRYVAAAERYADRAWRQVRDPATGLFRHGGRATLLQQAAFVQLYAALARRVTAGP
jgi:Glycosyl hydrolase family 76